VAASFALLYAQTALIIGTRYLFPMTLVEGAVLASQLARLGAVFGARRLREASLFSILDVMSLETFAFPVLGLMGLVTGDAVYAALGLQVIFGWTVSLLLLSPSIMIYRFARSMRGGSPLSTLLPFAAVLFGLLGSMQGLPPPAGAGGPSALFGQILSSVLGASLGSLREGSTGVAAAAVVTFFALAVYSTTGAEGPRTNRSGALSVALAGALAALGWEAGASQLTTNPLMLLTVPTALVGGTLWWVTREPHG